MKMENCTSTLSKNIVVIVVIFMYLSSTSNNNANTLCEARRVYSTFNTNDFFVFVAKFGFQKTVIWNQNVTQGYIFGNITTSSIPNYDNGLPMSKLHKREASSTQSHNREGVNNRISPAPGVGSNNLPDKNDSTIKQDTFSNVWSNVNNDFSPKGKNGGADPANPSKLSTPDPNSNFASSAASSISVNKSTSSSASTTSKPTLPSSSFSSSLPSSLSAQEVSSSRPRSHSPNNRRLNSNKYFPATLVVIDRSYFIDFYRARLLEDKNEACAQMFKSISENIFDETCFPYQKEMFLRRIPCNANGYCPDEKNISTIVGGHQFTYPISVKTQPRFWYVSIVACYLDQATCQWKHSANADLTIDYDIWLVNGNPYQKKQNPLEYQFSFDKQDTAEIYLVFFICYLILVPLQIHAVLRQKHIVPRLFTGSVALELGAVLCNVVHILSFSTDGEGYPRLAVFGDILDILARAIFMLILLVLAKGWAVTRVELRSKPLIFSIWVIYSVIHILLYVWNQTEVDVIEDIEEYQTWPGWLILVLRTLIMIWFVYELKDTMDHEHQPHKLNFFLHFGAAALVWFIYLPIVALIALQVSPLWRSKLLLGITYSADCLAFATMTHLLWPTRSQQYFLLASKIDTSLNDELEEFDEAPHVRERHNPYGPPRHASRLHYSIHDVSFPEAVSLTHTEKSNNHNHHNTQIQNNRNINTNSRPNGNGHSNGTVLNDFAASGSYVEDKDNLMLIQT